MQNPKIKSIHARQLIDCKCRPMVEVDVLTDTGDLGSGCAPTGLTVGMHESYVLRDQDSTEYGGMSVHSAVDMVNTVIAPALIGADIFDQKHIDETMIQLDGTANKSRLGGNSIYSVSIACFRAAAAARKIPLYEHIAQKPITKIPVPSFNVINGGRYPGLTQAFNEFLIVPYGAPTVEKAVEMGVTIFQKLPDLIRELYHVEPKVASSYGYAAFSESPDEILSLMQKAVAACGFQDQVIFALDCASSEMYDASTGTYYLMGKQVKAQELIAYAKMLTQKYPILFIEDLLDENDWENWPLAKKALTQTNIVGDDLIVTNLERLKTAHETHSIDGFILKPNQVGTISEALLAYDYARKHGLFGIPSGRSGGVIGDVVMDFALGLGIDFIKNGAPRSGERIDKLNYLMRAADLNPGAKLSDLSQYLKFQRS